MASEWTKYKIGELFELQNGFAFKGKDFIDSGVPVIKIKNVKAGKIVLKELSYVSKDIADKTHRFYIRPGDILITMSGNRLDGSPDTWVGKVALFKEEGEYLLNQRVGILRPRSEAQIDVDFCAYCLSSWEYQNHFISSANSSGGQANISPAMIYDTEILLPDLGKQNEIADLLKTIDLKIKNSDEIALTAEGIAREIYEEWFSNLNMPNLQFTEGNMDLPLRWRWGKVRDIAVVNVSSIGKNDHYAYIDYVEISSVFRGVVNETSRYHISEAPSRAKRKLSHGDTVLSTVRPNRGAYFLSLSPRSTLIGSTGFAVFTPQNVPYTFLYVALTQQHRLDYYGHVADGGAYPAINQNLIMDMEILIPDERALELYHETVLALFEIVDLCHDEVKYLALAKETLIRKLTKPEMSN